MTINTGNIEYSVGINTTEMDKGAKKVEAGVNKINTQMNKVAASTAKASGGFARLSRSSGQAGIQIQQFVGQIQGGQSAMLALSQQAADLGIVMGAPLVGAVIGLSASFAGMLLPSLLETENALEQFNEKQKASQEATNEFIKSTDAASKNNAILTATAKLNREYDLLTQKISNARAEQEKITQEIGTASETAVGRLQARFNSLSETITESEEKQKTLSKQIDETFMQGLSEATDQTEEARRGLTSFTQALQTQVETLGMSERGLALYTAEQLGATQADIDSINAKYDIIEASRAQLQAEKELNAEKSKAKTFAEGVISKGMTEDERFASELEKLTTLREQGLIAQQLYDEAIVASVENRARQIEKVNHKQEISELARMNMLLSSSSNFFGAMADIVANGADEQSSAYKIMFGISKGFAAAQAALNLTTAISNASALPWPTNIPAMAQALAAGTQLVSSISGAQYNGGREMGGPVSAGSMYRVGERGPEIYSAGGKNYMIPGESGQVVNNKNAFGGGMSNVNVVVNNNAPGTTASASRDDAGNIEVVINAISDQVMSGQGKFARALKQGTNTQFKASL